MTAAVAVTTLERRVAAVVSWLVWIVPGAALLAVARYVFDIDGSTLLVIAIPIVVQPVMEWWTQHRGDFAVGGTRIGPIGKRLHFERGALARFTVGADGCPMLEVRQDTASEPTTIALLGFDGALRATPRSYELLAAAVRANEANAAVADQLDALVADTADRAAFAKALREEAASMSLDRATAPGRQSSRSAARWTDGAWGLLVVLVLFTITALDGPLRWRLLLALAVVGVVITWFVGRKVSTNGARLTMHWQHFQADGGIRATLDEDGNEATLRVRSGIHRAKCVVRRDGVVRDPATWQAVATALSIDPANAAVAQRLHALATASSG